MSAFAVAVGRAIEPGRLDEHDTQENLDSAEITQKYGVQVSRDLSLPELYAIVTGLNEILSIARQDHASLEAGDCRSPELGEMEARIAMANRINQQFGTSLDWRQYDFLELFMLDEKLRGKSQTAEK